MVEVVVVCLLGQAGITDHEEMEKIVSLIPNITHKGQSATVSAPIDPSGLLPGQSSTVAMSHSILNNANSTATSVSFPVSHIN